MEDDSALISNPSSDTQTSPSPGLSRRKSRVFWVFLAIFCVVTIVAGSEAFFRLYRRFYAPRKLALVRENPHGTGSYRLLPGLDVTTHVEGRKVRLRTNSLGMPWREVSRAKPAGARRVAFVGDSFTFGLWADTWKQGFAGVVDAILAPGGFEVLNFGTPGYGLDDMALQIREDVIDFRPDYLVLVFYNGNDFSDTWLGTGKYRVLKGRLTNAPLMNDKVPPAYRAKPRSPKGAGGPGERVQSFLKSHLGFYRLLSRRKPRGISREFRVSDKFLSKSFWSQDPYPPIANEARDVSLRRIAEIDDLCRRTHVRLLLVALPDKQQVYSKAQRGPGYDIRRPQIFVEEFARERGIPYLDLLPVARRHLEETKASLYARRDAHLNDEGHRLFGRVIAAWLEEIAVSAKAGSRTGSGLRGNGKGPDATGAASRDLKSLAVRLF